MSVNLSKQPVATPKTVRTAQRRNSYFENLRSVRTGSVLVHTSEAK